MCYDISFSTTIEMVTDYLPGLLVDPQLGIDYNMNRHFQIREERSYPIIISQDGMLALTPMKWGIEVSIDRHSPTFNLRYGWRTESPLYPTI